MEPVSDTNYLQSNAFISASELVDGMCLREGDMQKVNRPLYLALLKEEYIRMNLSSIKETKRILTQVNQQLKCINAPSDYLLFHSIGGINEFGKFKPLILNDKIKTDDIIDIHATSVCGCECGCDNAYCSNVKNYELIESEVPMGMPDGSTQIFPSYIRKKLLVDGSLVTEISEPVKKYVNNAHVATVLEISEEFSCKLELKECGCIKPIHANESLINAKCDAVDFAYEAGCCRGLQLEHPNFYKVNDIGNRIHFPPNFPYKTVLLRYFADTKTKDLRIPILCARVMRVSVKLEQVKWNKEGDRAIAKWKAELKEAVDEMNSNLARLKLEDFYVHVIGIFNVL